MTETEERQLNV